jgi:hypothetical protein
MCGLAESFRVCRRILWLPCLLVLQAGLADEREEEELPARIQEAIERGRRHLLDLFPHILSQPSPDYPMGNIALPLAALLRAGTPAGNELLVQALSRLETEEPGKTYSAAVYLMALDALVQARHREAREAASAGPTRVLQPAPAQAEGPVRARMEAMVAWLVSARNHGEGTWHYRPSGGGGKARKKRARSDHDYSNTQFAVLGLEIGLRHRIPVPREVFAEIADQFTRSQLREDAPLDVTITFNPGKRAFLVRGGAVARSFRLPIGGWAYNRSERPPYGSMTAAGASCLLVARNGLGGSLPAASQSALDSALGWITRNFDRFLAGGGGERTVYYYLYSLEKAGDIGDIVLFGQRDWYLEGARELVRRQDHDGGWGTAHDTSFALLFLTRATRAGRALPPPRVITRAGGDKEEAGDRVYLSAIDGYVSAAEFFAYLGTTGERELVKVAEEVVRNYPPARQGELVPHLLALWSDHGDPVSVFARKALHEVTGEKYADAAGYRRWHQTYLAACALEGTKAAGAELEKKGEQARALLAEAEGLKLKGRLVDLIGRERLAAPVPLLIDELLSTDAAYRKRVADALERVTGQRFLGDEATPAAAREAAAEWRAFWLRDGDGLVAAARIRAIIAGLEAPPGTGPDPRGGGPAGSGGPGASDGDRLLETLIAEGRPAVPPILQAMERPEFPARLWIALERITGQRLGPRPRAWRAWWEAQGRAKEGARPR